MVRLAETNTPNPYLLAPRRNPPSAEQRARDAERVLGAAAFTWWRNSAKPRESLDQIVDRLQQ